MHDITIRKETPDDRAAIFELNLRAFGQPAEATLVDALRLDGDFIPEHSLVVVREGKVAGHNPVPAHYP